MKSMQTISSTRFSTIYSTIALGSCTKRSAAMRLRQLSLLVVAALLMSAPLAASARNADEGGGVDPSAAPSPAAAAARLSFVEGNVRVTQDSQIVADPAVVNMPLFEGTEIATANDGRAEIQLEDGSIARLSPNTTLVLSVLQKQGSGSRTELVLRSGLAYFELQPGNADHRLRVNYGDAFFTANNFSIIRLTSDAPPAELAVFTGSVRLERADALQLDVHAGETLTLDGTDSSRYNLSSSIAANSWDNWNSDRDQFLNSEAADKTAATGSLQNYPTDGMNDLDANGSWYNLPGQGYVWSPYDAQSEGADFDPYGYGNWVSYPQYGYLWVSGYSWGYSPYQCGLWDYYEDFGWAWAPGTGCSPWLGGGGPGWIYRLGNNRPPGYRPPHRPPTGPYRPKPRDGGPVPVTPRRISSPPIIAVDRRTQHDGGATTAAQDNQGTAFIAGRAVQPLPPLAPRQSYIHPGQGYVDRTSPGATGGSRSIYVPITPVRPAPISPVMPTPRPIMPRSEPFRPAPAPMPRMSAPPPPPRAAPSPSPHK